MNETALNYMDKKEEFLKLLIASFISQTGSYFLTLALSAFILMKTGSASLSALVFVLSYLPSIFVSGRLGHWIDRHVSKMLLARNEILSITMTIFCGLCIKYELSIFLLCLGLGIRSIFVFIGRSAAIKWLKMSTTPSVQTKRIKVFYLGFFLSTAIAGILATLILKQVSIFEIALIDSASYLVSFGIYLSLIPLKAEIQIEGETAGTTESLRKIIERIFSIPVVKTSFLLVCITQAVFQGAYSALVSYLPLKVHGTGLSGVGLFQLSASIGITLGFLINWIWARAFSEKDPTFPKKSLLLSGVTIMALLVSVMGSSFTTSIMAFFIMNLGYECIWLHHSSEFFRASPKSSVAKFQFTLASCAAFLMSVSTLTYSLALDHVNPLIAITLTLALSGALTWKLLSRKSRLGTEELEVKV